MNKFLLIFPIFILCISCNPFAPGLDDSADGLLTLLSDRKTLSGVFQNFKYAYTFRDTTVYGQLFDDNFMFLYRDYDRGVDISWGRDEEMRATHGLFQNVQRLDLVWNDTVPSSIDLADTLVTFKRSFNLTVTFNPIDIIYVDGYANLTLERPKSDEPWMIVRWRDESNY